MTGNITNEELAEKGFTENDISTLRSYIDELMNANLELKELKDTMQEKVLDAFDAFMEKIDKSVEKIEYLNNVIENYKNIIDLVGAKTLGLNDEFMKNLS
jgi:FtsZ-binding cell division protein ZapB